MVRSRPRVVILGGGFGGIYVARQLERLSVEAEICLVNRENYFVFQPLLPEVISGSIGLVDTVSPIRRLCPRTQLYVREVEGVDLEARTVSLAPGSRPRSLVLEFDHLVIAAGTTTNLSAIPGAAEHALPFRTLGDALRLRNRVLEALEEADTEPDAHFRRRLLTFVVAGGGFSGVEVVAELHDLVRRVSRQFRNVAPEDVRCVLVHSHDRILPEISPRLAAYAQRLLAERGVELRLRDRVVAVTADSVVLRSGDAIAARTLVSTVPAAPVPLVQFLGCAKEKGRIVTNPCLEVIGHEGRVWAVGDCARVRTPRGVEAPPSAQHATREAKTVAGNIAASIAGRPQKPFTFTGLGRLGSLGHHSAVAEMLGLRFSGFPAWLVWRTVYLSKLPGFDRKVRVALDWFTALVLPTELVQLRVQSSDSIVAEHFEAGETVFEQGDVGDRAYVIRTGAVAVMKDGREVARLGPGDCFGEMALLADVPRTATVRATDTTDVLAIGKADFTKLLASFPDLQTWMASVVARRSSANGLGTGPS